LWQQIMGSFTNASDEISHVLRDMFLMRLAHVKDKYHDEHRTSIPDFFSFAYSLGHQFPRGNNSPVQMGYIVLKSVTVVEKNA